jgi:photosystem II stability/assembly factor-like uncharacterized protein
MKSTKNAFLIIISIIIITQLSCSDNTTEPEKGEWSGLGLEGKLVNDLKLIDSYLYACAGKDGLYRLDLNQSDSGWTYLGFSDSGLLRQLYYGVTSIVKIPSTNRLIVGLATHRDTSEVGVFRSTDEGSTWIASDVGIGTDYYPKSTEISCLYVNTFVQNTIYAGLYSTIYKSLDGGNSWYLVQGIHGVGGLGRNAIRIAHNNPSTIWAGGETSRFAPYLLNSTDGGESWSDYIKFPANFGPYTDDNAVYDIAIDPSNDNILYFGMLGVIGKTTDKGKTFERILGWEDGIYKHWRLSINPDKPLELFATGAYLYKTNDGGKSWSKITPPMDEIYALEMNWQDKVLYVSVSDPENGIYKYNFR